MEKKELKTYLSALKTFRGKTKTLPVLKGVAIKGNTLIATDLEHYAEFNIGTKLGDGVFDEFVFDLLTTKGLDADIADSKTNDLDDYPVLATEWEDELYILTDADIDHIINAVECVSKDATRPVLQVVALTDGLISAIDGYVLYSSKQSERLGFVGDKFAYLDKPMVMALKKLRKFGVWTIGLSKDNQYVKITNGVFSIKGKNEGWGRFPDIRYLLSQKEHFNTTITFDYATVSALASKDRAEIDIEPMTNIVFLEKKNTGVEVEIKGEQDLTRSIELDTRKVIMPKTGREHCITLDNNLLKKIAKGKSITLLTNLDQFGMIEVL